MNQYHYVILNAEKREIVAMFVLLDAIMETVVLAKSWWKHLVDAESLVELK
jgi:hypothetical protein